MLSRYILFVVKNQKYTILKSFPAKRISINIHKIETGYRINWSHEILSAWNHKQEFLRSLPTT